MFGSFYSFPKTADFGLFTLHFGLSHYFILFFNFGYYLGGKKKKEMVKWPAFRFQFISMFGWQIC